MFDFWWILNNYIGKHLHIISKGGAVMVNWNLYGSVVPQLILNEDKIFFGLLFRV